MEEYSEENKSGKNECEGGEICDGEEIYEEGNVMKENNVVDLNKSEVERMKRRRLCENCRRCDTDIFGNRCEGVHISAREGLCIGRHTALIKCEKTSEKKKSWMLCQECVDLVHFYMKKKSQRAVPWGIAWPAFLWYSFILPENEDRVSNIWKLLPRSLRLSWIESCNKAGYTI